MPTRFRTTVCAALVAAALMAISAMPASAQVFSELKNALVDYSKADMEPGKACEALGNFKSKEIAQISAEMIPTAGAVPAPDETDSLGDVPTRRV